MRPIAMFRKFANTQVTHVMTIALGPSLPRFHYSVLVVKSEIFIRLAGNRVLGAFYWT